MTEPNDRRVSAGRRATDEPWSKRQTIALAVLITHLIAVPLSIGSAVWLASEVEQDSKRRADANCSRLNDIAEAANARTVVIEELVAAAKVLAGGDEAFGAVDQAVEQIGRAEVSTCDGEVPGAEVASQMRDSP
jgi:hypothetical protein